MEKNINDVILEEISNCNKFNYLIEIGNLILNFDSKNFNQSLFDKSFSFIGMNDSKFIIIYLKKINHFWLNKEDTNHYLINLFHSLI